MPDLDGWQEIYAALSRNRLRTALTAFGVFWGIFLLMLLLASGSGLANGATRDYAGSATNSFFIWSQRTTRPYHGMAPGRRPQLTNADAAAVRQGVPEAGIVAPRNQLGGFGGGNNVGRGTKAGAFGVMGDYPEVLAMEPLLVHQGRFLNALDLAERRKVAVIGNRVEEVLFRRGEEAIGQQIRINGVYFKVVGVFRSRQSGEAGDRDAQTVYIPFTTFQTAFNQGDRVGWLAITSAAGVPASVTETRVLDLLKSRHRVAPDDNRAFGHWNTEEEFLKLQGLFQGIRILVWIVGLGTLAAGVIGVSNIMLVIVKERTREIGIRRAVGATPFAVMRQIVLEATLLTFLAGWLGLMAGIGLVELARKLLPAAGDGIMFLNPDVSPAAAVQALLVLVAAGVIAGLIPARRAVGLTAVEALRSE